MPGDVFNKSRGRGFGMSAQLPVRPEPRASGSSVPSKGQPKSLDDISEFDILNMPNDQLMQFFVKNNLLTQMYASATMVGQTRQEKYRDYETMMDNVLMTSYLDLLVDDALQFDMDRHATVWVNGDTPYQSDIEDFLADVLDIEITGPGLLYLLAQYGDFFAMPVYEPGLGIVSVRTDIFPGNVWRLDLNGKLFAFAYQDMAQTFGASYSESVGSTKVVSSRGFVHFMLNFRPDFHKTTIAIPKESIKDFFQISGLPESTLSFVNRALVDDKEVLSPLTKERTTELREVIATYRGEVSKIHLLRDQRLEALELDYLKQQTTLLEKTNLTEFAQKTLLENANRIYLAEQNKISSEYTSIEVDLTHGAYNLFKENEYFYFNISSRYGNSMLYAARKDVKILNLVEQALALSRLARSGVARIYYVNTEDATPEERRDIMRYMEETFTQQQTFDAGNKLWKTEYYPFNYLDDIFLPVTGGKGDTRIEQIGGDIDIKAIVDIEWFLSKVFAGLKVPKSYLGFEEMMPGALGSTTLVRLDIRYARTIKKLQRSFQLGIRTLLKYHLEAKYQKAVEWDEIPLALTTVSGAEESDRWSALKEKLDIVASIMSFVETNEGDKTLMARTLFDNFLDINYEGLTAETLFPDDLNEPETEEDESSGEMEAPAGGGSEAMPMRPDVEDVGDITVPDEAEEIPAEEV